MYNIMYSNVYFGDDNAKLQNLCLIHLFYLNNKICLI